MLVGYARVSTQDQNFDLQLDALKKSGCEKIFQDVVSGSKAERKALKEAMDYVRDGQGDTLVVWRLDRLGRSLGHLIEFMNGLRNRGIGFRSIVEAIDTTTPTGQFFFHVTGAFAELERNLIRERTMAGLSAARARGRKGGRPKALAPEKFKMALQLYDDRNNSVSSISETLGITKRTLYRYLERNRAAQQNG
jgi:DNA invertase Pin-like site-specific DNA recombinase